MILINNQEWANHRMTQASRFTNSVWEPGFNLNSPTLSRETPSEFGRKVGLVNFSFLTQFFVVMTGLDLKLTIPSIGRSAGNEVRLNSLRRFAEALQPPSLGVLRS